MKPTGNINFWEVEQSDGSSTFVEESMLQQPTFIK